MFVNKNVIRQCFEPSAFCFILFFPDDQNSHGFCMFPSVMLKESPSILDTVVRGLRAHYLALRGFGTRREGTYLVAISAFFQTGYWRSNKCVR